jgi:hypothetical protein
MKTSFLTHSLATAFLALCATAQSVNIDIGQTAATNPTNAYGAAAAQPGFWNWFQVPAAAMNAWQPLANLAGAASGAAIRFTAGDDGPFSFNSPLVGEEERLMDDVHSISAGDPATYEITGLVAGGYWIYTYAWAPDDPVNFRTKVEVVGATDPSQVIGGAWPGAQRYQTTFAKHFKVVAPGETLVIRAIAEVGFGSVNGFQLVFGAGGACDGEIDIYCTPKVNSNGCVPAIGYAFGPPSAGACGCPFVITATNVIPGRNGLLFYGRSGPRATPFFGGTLCVEPPLARTPVQVAGGAGACGGSYLLDFNDVLSGLVVAPGDPFWTQWYYRDPTHADGTGVGLTNALHFTVCF